jgi:hypothetical protein
MTDTVDDAPRSFTDDIKAVTTRHPTDGYPVIFANTPAFGDAYEFNREILSMIAEWIVAK